MDEMVVVVFGRLPARLPEGVEATCVAQLVAKRVVQDITLYQPNHLSRAMCPVLAPLPVTYLYHLSNCRW